MYSDYGTCDTGVGGAPSCSALSISHTPCIVATSPTRSRSIAHPCRWHHLRVLLCTSLGQPLVFSGHSFKPFTGCFSSDTHETNEAAFSSDVSHMTVQTSRQCVTHYSSDVSHTAQSRETRDSGNVCSPNEDLGTNDKRGNPDFAKHFSMVRRPNRVLTPLKSASQIRIFLFCHSFPNLRLGSIK